MLLVPNSSNELGFLTVSPLVMIYKSIIDEFSQFVSGCCQIDLLLLLIVFCLKFKTLQFYNFSESDKIEVCFLADICLCQ